MTEDLLSRDVGGQLHEQARRAHPHMQRVERLAVVELFGGEVVLARRRHAEVDEGVRQLGRAEAAARCDHGLPTEVTGSARMRSWSSSRPVAMSSRILASRTKRGPSKSVAAKPNRRMSPMSSSIPSATVHRGAKPGSVCLILVKSTR